MTVTLECYGARMAEELYETLEDAMQAVDAEMRVEQEFQASCDFFLACQLIGVRRDSEAVRIGKARWPIQAYATCAALSLELALKSRTILDGGTPPKTHRVSEVFALLSLPAQEDIAAGLLLDGQPATLARISEVLRLCDKTFETWRYVHEHRDADFMESYIFAILRAVHSSILRLRPDWQFCRDLLT